MRLDLEASPFAKAPFQGAASARELAERMRADPKPAGPLLESGEVARWFAANGWSYPVAGTPAAAWRRCSNSSSAWACPSRRRWNCRRANSTCSATRRRTVRGQLTLRTPARKWVYAQAAGDQPWLRVTTPNVSGPQQTTISFEADPALMGEGPVQEGLLQISANAGQRFLVRVRVEVSPACAATARRPRRPRSPRRNGFRS